MTANEPISLLETPIDLVIRGQTFQANGQPTLRLIPRPQLVIEFESANPVFAQLTQIGSKIVLPVYGSKLTVQAVSLSIGDKVRGTLVPTSQPCTIIRNTGSRLQSVNFKVLNFPDFLGNQDRMIEDGKGGGCRVGHVQLNAGPWEITIAAEAGSKGIYDALKKDGGCAITHSGIVRRTSGKTFTIGEAERLFEALRLFISFARGAFSSTTFEHGFAADGTEAWLRWGSHVVQPWLYSPSWFDWHHAEVLSEVFPGFWDRFSEPTWRETISAVLYWYLRSNSHGEGAGVDGGLILTQAALERLAFACGHQSGNTAQQIRALIKGAGINPRIPTACQRLRRMSKSNKWIDGPQAITAIRNDLTHARQYSKSGRQKPYFEAWNLAQWYLELLLLHLFGHSGIYGNRLTQQWRGEVATVPWAKKKVK